MQALNPTIFANKTKSKVFEMKLYNLANKGDKGQVPVTLVYSYTLNIFFPIFLLVSYIMSIFVVALPKCFGESGGATFVGKTITTRAVIRSM